MLDFILSLLGISQKPNPAPEGHRGSSESLKESETSESKRVEIVEPTPKYVILVKPEEKERLETELKDLESKNPELNQLLINLAKMVKEKFNKDLIITMIYRTQSEQDYLYRDDSSYKLKKFKSPHQFWHAVDLRSWIYTESERSEMVKWLNTQGIIKNNYYKWTSKVHEVGSNGLHFHIQFAKA